MHRRNGDRQNAAMQTITCANCSQHLAPSIGDNRTLCPRCGSKTRTIHLQLNAAVKMSSGLRGIAFSLGSKSKWFVKLISEPVWQYTRSVWGHRLKMEDKRNNKYIEEIVNTQSGEVLYKCKGKLTDHSGHGSAKLSTSGKKTVS